jgi:D-alanine-D-alanine ligase
MGRYRQAVESHLVAVVFGGRSSEHSISILSAQGIIPALRAAGHEVLPIGISRAGGWFRVDVDALTALTDPLPELPAAVEELSVHWTGSRATWIDATGTKWSPDVVFPILHGPWGEDGSVQGFLDVLGVPYVGSGVLASACVMDKLVMKTVLQEAGLPVGPWFREAPAWQGPIFVKPARAGSSIGISRVDHPDAMDAAVALAHRHDNRLIFETALDGAREIECGVLQLPTGETIASTCAEISVAHGFYDFDAKYRSDAATLTVPADIPADIAEQVQSLSIAAFKALNCEGLARADFFYLPDGSILVNELNTLPGFTPISMFPRMWQASGMTYVELVDTLVRSALMPLGSNSQVPHE